MSDYVFHVTKAEDVDVLRIIREAEGRDAILIMSGRNGLLLLKQEWLERYTSADRLEVAGDYICRNWGNSRLPACWQTDLQTVEFGYAVGSEMPGYSQCRVTASQVAEIARQIAAAKAYVRKLKVSVTYLA